MAHQHSKGLNVSHIGAYKAQIKKLKEKMEELNDIIVKYKIVLNRYKNGGWTEKLFWCLIGVSTTWLYLLVFSLFQ